MPDVLTYCKDCLDTLDHMWLVDVAEPNGTWQNGPNERYHFLEQRRPSQKYPFGTGPYFLCGRHAPEGLWKPIPLAHRN